TELRSAARELVLRAPAPRRAPLTQRLLNLASLRPLVRRTLIAQVAKRAPREHYPAPYAIIELWSRYGARGSAAFEAEARSIAHLFTTETSRNLVRVFLLQDALKSSGGKSGAEIRQVHVVGAGVMGGDIAAWSALRGFSVTLEDRAAEYIEPAMKRAQELFDKRLREPAQNAAARERLRADVAGEGVAGRGRVVEAHFSNLSAEQEVYARPSPRPEPRDPRPPTTHRHSTLPPPRASRSARPP